MFDCCLLLQNSIGLVWNFKILDLREKSFNLWFCIEKIKVVVVVLFSMTMFMNFGEVV